MKQVPDCVPVVESGVGAGWPQVKGECPACGNASLFLASGGYVTCAVIKCPNPTAVADRLELPRPEPVELTDAEVDDALSISVPRYDRTERYPEWSNEGMRGAYRAGWEDGRA